MTGIDDDHYIDQVYERMGQLRFAPSDRRLLLDDASGTICVDPMLAAAEQFAFINKEYGVVPTTIQAYSKLKARIRTGMVREYRKTADRVFEVSAYDGYTLKAFNEAFGSECYGIEPTTAAVDFAKENFPQTSANIYNDIFENIASHPAFNLKFDVFIFSYCFQHLNDPAEALRQCAHMMADGGLLIIDEGMLLDHILTKEWPFVVRHLHSSKNFYFSSHGLRYLAGQAGFRFLSHVRYLDDSLPHYAGLVFEYTGKDHARPIDRVTSRLTGRHVRSLYQSLGLSVEDKLRLLQTNFPDLAHYPPDALKLD